MLTQLWGFGYPLLGAIILVKEQWINNLELLGEHFFFQQKTSTY